MVDTSQMGYELKECKKCGESKQIWITDDVYHVCRRWMEAVDSIAGGQPQRRRSRSPIRQQNERDFRDNRHYRDRAGPQGPGQQGMAWNNYACSRPGWQAGGSRRNSQGLSQPGQQVSSRGNYNQQRQGLEGSRWNNQRFSQPAQQGLSTQQVHGTGRSGSRGPSTPGYEGVPTGPRRGGYGGIPAGPHRGGYGGTLRGSSSYRGTQHSYEAIPLRPRGGARGGGRGGDRGGIRGGISGGGRGGGNEPVIELSEMNYKPAPTPTPDEGQPSDPHPSQGGSGGSTTGTGNQGLAPSTGRPDAGGAEQGTRKNSRYEKFTFKIDFNESPWKKELPGTWHRDPTGQQLRNSCQAWKHSLQSLKEVYERFAILAPQMTDQSRDAMMANRAKLQENDVELLVSQVHALIPSRAVRFRQELETACAAAERDVKKLFMKHRHTVCSLSQQVHSSVQRRAGVMNWAIEDHELPSFELMGGNGRLEGEALLISEATTVMNKVHAKMRREVTKRFWTTMSDWKILLSDMSLARESIEVFDGILNFPALEASQEMPWFTLPRGPTLDTETAGPS